MVGAAKVADKGVRSASSGPLFYSRRDGGLTAADDPRSMRVQHDGDDTEGIMDTLINGLIGQYESGALSRRELVGALAALSVTANGAFAGDAGFQSAGINHVSITASNLQRTVDFYARVFNLGRQPGQNANLVQLQVGKDAHLSIRQGAKPGFDHFAIGVPGFNKDRVIANLRARGAMPIDGGDGAGLHVADPDGLFVQVIGSVGAG